MRARIIIGRSIAAALLFVIGTSRRAHAEDTNTSSRLDYASFQIISERNIFNPNRASRSGRTTRTEPEKRVTTESFTLVGTLSYDKGYFAFFDGSSSQYQKALKAADTIAGYKIVDIANARVTLESTNGQAVELPVGKQMRRQVEGGWQLAEYAESSGSASRASAAGEKSGGSSGPEADEVLKRLMEKRERESGGGLATNAETSPATAAEIDKPAKIEKPDAAPADGADDVLKKLLQKREQELNK